MNRRVVRLLSASVLAAFTLLCVACASDGGGSGARSYTDEALRALDIDTIRAEAKTDAVKALWHARLFADNEGEGREDAEALYRETLAMVENEFAVSVDTGKWVRALSLYRTLSALGRGPSGWTAETLARKQGIPSLVLPGQGIGNGVPDEPAPPPAKVSEMIRGTVTIWVDRGYKIEKGLGYPERVIGSGFFIDKRGYIVTNHHVISSEVDPKYEGYSRLYVKMADDPDTRVPAKVIGWDEVFDLALLKVEVEAPYVFTLGSSADLAVGDRIFAIGTPLGLEKTLTSGIVSSTDRRLFPMGSVLQIDAAINAGNSGGPVIDGNGAVQAVAFAGITYYEGLNFAIPVEYLKLELPRLYEGGKVSHGWTGSWGRTHKDQGNNSLGAEVFYVMPGGPSAVAGICPGTVITAVDGVPVTTIEGLQARLLLSLPGSITRMTDSTGTDYYVYVDERPENPGLDIYKFDNVERSFIPIFGMSMTQTGGGFKKKYTVTSIVKGGTADESGFSVQDPIEIQKMMLSPDKDALYIEIYTKKRKNGYLDAFLALSAPLDSPWYF